MSASAATNPVDEDIRRVSTSGIAAGWARMPCHIALAMACASCCQSSVGSGRLTSDDDRGDDEFLETLLVGDVVVKRHRSSSQCRRQRSHAQRAQARLVDDTKGRDGDLIGGEPCPHIHLP